MPCCAEAAAPVTLPSEVSMISIPGKCFDKEWASCLHPTFVQGCSRTGILPQSYLDTCARSWCSKRCSHAGMLPSHTGAHWQASCLSLTSILQRACSAHKEAR
eukprot:1142528-Pelagomonas_calceolata.AAC.2